MPEDTVLQELQAYIKELRLHLKGRRALHLKISLLERHLRDSSYRRSAAAYIQPLIRDYAGRSFVLSNGDVVIFTQGADVSDLDAMLANIRSVYAESSLLRSNEFSEGVSNTFVHWYDLQNDFDALREHFTSFDGKNAGSSPPASSSSAAASKNTYKSNTSGQETASNFSAAGGKKKIRILPIDVPKRKAAADKELDPETFLTLTKSLYSTDVSRFICRQDVVARTSSGDQVPIMVHRFVSKQMVLETLLEGKIVKPDRWLDGYISDFLAKRMLLGDMNLNNEGSLASSMMVTSASVLDQLFKRFNRTLGDTPRGQVILQFALGDIIQSPLDYTKAAELVREQGFKVSISGIDVISLGWLSRADLSADFLKITFPGEVLANWYDDTVKQNITQAVDFLGKSRFILDNVTDAAQVDVAQKLGISLFQGDFIAPPRL